jgi:hypothetical protein
MVKIEICRRTALAGLVASAVASTLALATPAHAVDDKTAPGSNCVASTGNNPDGTRFFLVNSAFFYADSGAPLRADCPILKERVGRGIAKASVLVVDNNPGAGISCQLFSERVAAGAAVVQTAGPTVTSSGASPLPRQLNLGSLPPAAGTGSYWFISCTLASSTGILSYYVDEQQ